MEDSSATVSAIIEAGLSVSIAEAVGSETVEVEVEEPAEEPAVEEKPPTEMASATTTSVCSICGKSLILPKSVLQGMGDICAAHARYLGGMTLKEHQQSVKLEELTEDWIPLKEWFAAGNAIGITSHRLMQVAGGDRALRKPLHPSFAVKYYKRLRYVHKSALEHLEEARLK